MGWGQLVGQMPAEASSAYGLLLNRNVMTSACGNPIASDCHVAEGLRFAGRGQQASLKEGPQSKHVRILQPYTNPFLAPLRMARAS